MKSSILRSRLDNIEKDLLHSIYYIGDIFDKKQ